MGSRPRTCQNFRITDTQEAGIRESDRDYYKSSLLVIDAIARQYATDKMAEKISDNNGIFSIQ